MKCCAQLPAPFLGSQGPLPPNAALLPGRSSSASVMSEQSHGAQRAARSPSRDGEGWGLLLGSGLRVGGFSENLTIIAQAPALSWPLEFQCLLFKACLPLCQEELERTLVLEWFCSLGETPGAEADEYQMRAHGPRPFTPSDLPGTLTHR